MQIDTPINHNKMDALKNVGIWMDHSYANLIELKDSSHHTIESEFTHTKKVDAIYRSGHIMHNKEQQLNKAYCDLLSEEILKLTNVLLFVPISAKTELHNYLKTNLHFKDIQIDIEPADKMTDNEKVAFVKQHFVKQ
jgi:hypothetical protein